MSEETLKEIVQNLKEIDHMPAVRITHPAGTSVKISNLHAECSLCIRAAEAVQETVEGMKFPKYFVARFVADVVTRAVYIHVQDLAPGSYETRTHVPFVLYDPTDNCIMSTEEAVERASHLRARARRLKRAAENIAQMEADKETKANG